MLRILEYSGRHLRTHLSCQDMPGRVYNLNDIHSTCGITQDNSDFWTAVHATSQPLYYTVCSTWTSLLHCMQWTSLLHCIQWTSLLHCIQWTSLQHCMQWTSLLHCMQWTSLLHFIQWTYNCTGIDNVRIKTL